MRNLVLVIITSALLTSCSTSALLTSSSKSVIKDVDIAVVENGHYFGQPAFAINVEYTPNNFKKIADFAVEIVITATPINNVTNEADWLPFINQPTFTRVITLHNEDFTPCNGKMVHRLGYHFNSQENSNGTYNITHTKRML